MKRKKNQAKNGDSCQRLTFVSITLTVSMTEVKTVSVRTSVSDLTSVITRILSFSITLISVLTFLELSSMMKIESVSS